MTMPLMSAGTAQNTLRALSYVIHRADEKGVSIHSRTDGATEAQRG